MKLGLPETRIGLIPGDGGTQRLTRLIGRARATQMIFTGGPITADEAQRIGLISEAVDDSAALNRALEGRRADFEGSFVCAQDGKSCDPGV